MLRGRHGIGGFTFEGRNRRPPRDPVNALLSFAYSLLVREVTTAAIHVGLDPYVGVFHRPRYGRPALALDLAEEFRPIVGDSIVISVINTGEIAPEDFIVRGGGYALTPTGRKSMIAAFERRMATEIQHPVFRYRVTYRRAIELQARILARVFTGEYASYRPFMTAEPRATPLPRVLRHPRLEASPRDTQVMVGHGDPLQYSVFLCDLSGMERTQLVSRLKKVLNESVDSVAIFDLGPTGSSGPARRIETIGPTRPMPISGEPTII